MLATFADGVREWLSAGLPRHAPSPGGHAAAAQRSAALAQAWQNVERATREAEVFNLERKPLVFKVFGWLAEAARG
jgi:DNA polymerase-3 subunit delta'